MKNKGKTTPRMAVGKLGEDAACAYLEQQGHSIIDRNCRRGHLEIDIVSVDREGIHFIEVKSRVAPVSARPEENVTRTKQDRIARAALRYLHTSKDPRLHADMEVSFDVVAVTFDKDDTIVDWFPNAWIPLYV